MSTRCVITVIDEHNSFSIYRHGDGYPDGDAGVIRTLEEGFKFAWELPRFEADDFAAALIRAWKIEGGGDIYFTKGHEHHGDLAYRYEIRQDGANYNRLEIRVFQRDYRDKDGNYRKETVWKPHEKHIHYIPGERDERIESILDGDMFMAMDAASEIAEDGIEDTKMLAAIAADRTKKKWSRIAAIHALSNLSVEETEPTLETIVGDETDDALIRSHAKDALDHFLTED